MRTNVTFGSAGLMTGGHLYTPDDGAAGPRPAIVVGHPGSGVKEQAAGLCARRLADQGFVTLAWRRRSQDPAVFMGMLDAAAEARTAEARGEGVQTFRLFPDTAEEARARGQHVFEGFEYYCTPRAQHPRSAKFLTWTSIDHMAFFDAFRAVSLIGCPLLMNVGRKPLPPG